MLAEWLKPRPLGRGNSLYVTLIDDNGDVKMGTKCNKTIVTNKILLKQKMTSINNLEIE